MSSNPLLAFVGLPPYDQIQPEHVAPAIDALLAEAEMALQIVTAQGFPAKWLMMAKVLDTVTERLAVAWGAVGHLNAVADTPALRVAYNEVMPRITAFWTRLGANELLYAKYKALDVTALNPEQRQAHKNVIRNFVLSGAELQGPPKRRYAAIQERQAELSQKFSENTLDATDAFALYVMQEDLDGVPSDVIAAARGAAEAEGRDGYKLTLKIPCYLPVMQFARNAALREKLYRAYVTRASEFGDPTFDNTTLIGEILALRQEEAELLGYRNFGELSLVPKMADSPEQVLEFLRDLATRAKPYGERDVADMREFAAQTLGIADPQAWDWTYIGERLRETRYAFNEQEVKQYFTAPKVMAGLFQLAETLFDITIQPDTAPVWHPSVTFYRIERKTPEGPRTIGQFYLDPSARTAKRGGAWMDGVRSRWLRPDTGTLQTPVAQLVCNFAEGVNGNPPLLTHDDVITLFHEFGHGLHHLLTQVNEQDVAGVNGVEWDAVELPSQFMENFCWEWDVVQHITAHVDTGEPLPRTLFDKMIAAKNFQSGLQTLRQVEFALFDMLLHTAYEARNIDPSGQRVLALLNQVRAEVAVTPAPPFSRSPNTFTHIFAGGYAAGYYSYKWAEVLSADAYAAFEEGPENAQIVETGRRYCQTILESGGSRPAMESFKAFRGREPRIDALLRHQGMLPAAATSAPVTPSAPVAPPPPAPVAPPAPIPPSASVEPSGSASSSTLPEQPPSSPQSVHARPTMWLWLGGLVLLTIGAFMAWNIHQYRSRPWIVTPSAMLPTPPVGIIPPPVVETPPPPRQVAATPASQEAPPVSSAQAETPSVQALDASSAVTSSSADSPQASIPSSSQAPTQPAPPIKRQKTSASSSAVASSSLMEPVVQTSRTVSISSSDPDSTPLAIVAFAKSPRLACANSNFIPKAQCIAMQCSKSEFASHGECQSMH